MATPGYTELEHLVGSDLTLSPTGDLALTTGVERTKERVLRRLMTNLGEYIWQAAYGAGLPCFIGRAMDLNQVKAIIRAQMKLEPSVQQTPPPDISAVAIQNGVAVSVTYQDSQANTPVVLSFNVTP